MKIKTTRCMTTMPRCFTYDGCCKHVRTVIPPMDRKFNETRTILFARLRSSLNMHGTERLFKVTVYSTDFMLLPVLFMRLRTSTRTGDVTKFQVFTDSYVSIPITYSASELGTTSAAYVLSVRARRSDEL